MKRRGKKMKKFIKYGSIVVISLVILISCNVNSYDCDVFAEEKNEEQNTETPRVGLEPTTTRLTAECSTIELSRIIYKKTT